MVSLVQPVKATGITRDCLFNKAILLCPNQYSKCYESLPISTWPKATYRRDKSKIITAAKSIIKHNSCQKWSVRNLPPTWIARTCFPSCG